MSKRPNGLGSVYMRQSDGRWLAAISVNGRQRTRTARTESEAWRKLAQLQREAEQGLAPDADRLTVAAYLRRWLQDIKPSVAPQTHKVYTRSVEKRLIPAIGRYRLRALTKTHVQSTINQIAATHPSLAQDVREHLSIALNAAVAEGLVLHNVCRFTRRPQYQTPEPPAIDCDTARSILEAVRGSEYEALYVTALATGLRLGELLGLTWADVDLDTGRVTVRRQMRRGEVGRELTTTLKSRAARRWVLLTDWATDTLRAQQQRQDLYRLMAGSVWRECGAVFTSAIGTPAHSTEVQRHFRHLMAQAGLPAFTPHDLRHGTATLLREEGAPTKLISEVLGHSGPGITERVYIQTTDQGRERALRALERVGREEETG